MNNCGIIFFFTRARRGEKKDLCRLAAPNSLLKNIPRWLGAKADKVRRRLADADAG